MRLYGSLSIGIIHTISKTYVSTLKKNEKKSLSKNEDSLFLYDCSLLSERQSILY